MNSNQICLRIFYILFILLGGALTIFSYGARFITPLAISLLPTEKAQARYVDSYVLTEAQIGSQQVLHHSHIFYAERSGLLISATAPSFEPTVAVRYVRAFPSLVVRDAPGGSLWHYYADTWTLRDFVPFFIWVCAILGVCVLLWRHIRYWRRVKDRGY